MGCVGKQLQRAQAAGRDPLRLQFLAEVVDHRFVLLEAVEVPGGRQVLRARLRMDQGDRYYGSRQSNQELFTVQVRHSLDDNGPVAEAVP